MFLCFDNKASRDRNVGWSVGRSVSLLVGFDTTFKKVPKPYERDCYDIIIRGYIKLITRALSQVMQELG